MGEWKEYKLKELTAKIGSGATPTGGDNSYKPEGISLIRSQNILDLQFSDNGLAFIDDDQADTLRNVTVESGDVLLNITGDSVARVCKVPESVLPARVNQHVAIIRADKEKLVCDYLLYFLEAKKEYLLSISEIGATRRALTKGMLEDLDLTIPKLPEQKSIASVLSSLDDKIDLLHRQNKTLEALAETLFRQWFVEEAEEGWETGKLGEFGKIICGKTPSKKIYSYFGGSIPFIRIPDMHGKTFIFDTQDILTEEGANSQQNKHLPPKSICVSCIATVGLVAMNAFSCQTNQQINSIVPNREIYRYFIYLKLATMKEELLAMASGGTATDNLNTGDFSNIEIIKPEDKMIGLFHNQVQPYFGKIFTNQTQIRTLTRLRDTLLPKLMSGEVRVNN